GGEPDDSEAAPAAPVTIEAAAAPDDNALDIELDMDLDFNLDEADTAAGVIELDDAPQVVEAPAPDFDLDLDLGLPVASE
ncbi:hypothetical protein NK983_34325, partial [Salmonella enterica subsp. enterica serovar Typhimurium]|nr:hypothetical protein [Salmonella enterica subsp. enterica serovar Typhimurium]